MLNFKNFLRQGKKAEWVTMLFLRSNSSWMETLGLNACVLTEFLASDGHWDLGLTEVDCDTDIELNHLSVEVKTATKPSHLSTFWAEVWSCGSRGYAHYLVHPPKFMVYLDETDKELYFYNGEMFVEKVKRCYLAGMADHNKFGTAVGLKFSAEDYKAGFLMKAPVQQLWYEVNNTQWITNKIEEQLNEEQPRPPVYKNCKGLPTL